MKSISWRTTFAPFVAAMALAACSSGGPSGLPSTSAVSAPQARYVPQWQARHLARAACPDVRLGEGQCAALIGYENAGPGVVGWTPADIDAAYRLPSQSKGKGQIVALVDAYDNPDVSSDLAEYRSYFGLPKAKFYKYNQKGQQGHYPKGDSGWGFEIDLDVDMVSAACPNCTIYLIEAKTNSLPNLGDADKEAVKLGATIVSNSWGCYQAGCTWHTHAFDAKGVTFLAAAGDIGYGSFAPAQFATVISVGGTVLSKSGSTYSEAVWPDTSGGCAPNIPKPSWQHDPDCSTRTANDIAAVAENVAVYDTFRYHSYSGWFIAYGTSLASPIIASTFALAGNSTKQDAGKVLWTLSKKKLKDDIHAITSGSINDCPPSLGGTYLCTAGTGQFGTYSGPTGWGTPNGIGVF
jgi:subtilase family serine protease